MNKRLYRNESDKVLGGVASGLADYMDIDVTVVRIAFLLLLFFGGSGFLIYIIMWIAIPSDRNYKFKTDYRVYEEPLATPVEPIRPPYERRRERSGSGRYWVGLILVALGFCFLFKEFNLIPYWFNIGKLWPLALVILGAWILTRPRNHRKEYLKTDSDAADIKTDTSKTDTDSTINPDQPLD